jgi:2-polyprenyl-3-methyl-5-hydroxy-6-metoxy-1,4-benzoquinol methylase
MEPYKNRRCPWWLGYVLILPIRKYGQDPDKILSPHIQKGMNILDFGSAMGYFSLPLARMTGATGTVYCVDIQEKMLGNLQKRAYKAGVAQIIKPLLVGKNYNPAELYNKIDFVLLFAVVHEVPEKVQLFADIYNMLKPGGKVLFAEPKGHVSPADFEKSLQLAKATGFRVADEKPMPKGLSAFLVK